jgi:hypothetical protein
MITLVDLISTRLQVNPNPISASNTEENPPIHKDTVSATSFQKIVSLSFFGNP